MSPSKYERIGLRLLRLLAALALLALTAAAGQRPLVLRGQVTDQLGGAIGGASVTVIDNNGKQQTTETDERGMYYFNGLAAGTYKLRAIAPGFADYEKSGVILTEPPNTSPRLQPESYGTEPKGHRDWRSA